MCGLVGAYNPLNAGVCSNDVLIKMRDKMEHRGPDGAGIWRSEFNDCVLGHRRLSILDLTTEAGQPMANQDESVVIIFNGEIYNHQQIREELKAKNKYIWKTHHSDTEVILHAYEEWGLHCLDKFYGMFAIAIYDRRNRDKPIVHLIRDRIGVKPLYISQTQQGEWVFASEIRALLEHPAVSPELNRTALWHYLTFIVAPAPTTMFKGIWKIPAGFGVTIDYQNQAKAWQWWDCLPSKSNMLKESDISEQEAVDQLLSLLRQSISRRMVSDVPFGALLSGGVDSSIIVALMSELMDRPVKTFTVGYDGHEEFNEFTYARKIAEQYKTDHYETKITTQQALDFLPLLVQLQDEPIADNVCIPLYFLSKLVKENNTTVVQVGEGADENFLGYWWCDHYREKYQNIYKPSLIEPKKGLFNKLLSRSNLFASDSAEDIYIRQRARDKQQLFWGGAVCWWGDMRSKLTPNIAPFKETLDCPIANLLPDSHRQLDSHAVVAEYLDKLNGNLIEPEVLQKIPYMEHKLRLPEHLLMRVDKMTMAHSIEARVPFLDHDIVNFALRLPLSYKLKDGIGKAVLKRAASPYIDNDMLYRRKQGFGAPMEKWFQDKNFAKGCHNAFENSFLVKENLIDKDYFSGLLKQQTQHSSGYSFHIWTVINAVLWYEVWVNKNFDCL